jgi:hypothetical protein
VRVSAAGGDERPHNCVYYCCEQLLRRLCLIVLRAHQGRAPAIERLFGAQTECHHRLSTVRLQNGLGVRIRSGAFVADGLRRSDRAMFTRPAVVFVLLLLRAGAALAELVDEPRQQKGRQQRPATRLVSHCAHTMVEGASGANLQL